MRKNGFCKAWQKRFTVALVTPWCLVAVLSSCSDSAVVSVVSSVEDESVASGPLSDSGADTAVAEQPGAAAELLVGFDTELTAEEPAVLRIMAVGDSITHGVSGATSFRKPLLDLLQSSGCEFEMVGSMSKNLPDTGFESPHEGYSGHRTDAFLTGQQSSFGNNQGISESMLQFAPQLVLLKIGTNDVNQNREVDSVIANIDQIVALILDAEPKAQVLVATLVPFFGSTDFDNPVNVALERLSIALEAWFLQAANPSVYLIDIREGFTADMLLPDLIHPNVSGDMLIASRFHQSIEENDLCQ